MTQQQEAIARIVANMVRNGASVEVVTHQLTHVIRSGAVTADEVATMAENAANAIDPVLLTLARDAQSLVDMNMTTHDKAARAVEWAHANVTQMQKWRDNGARDNEITELVLARV